MPKTINMFALWLSAVLVNGHICSADPFQEQTDPASSVNKNVATEPAKALYLTAGEFGIEGLPQQQYHFGVDYKNGTLHRVNLSGTVGPGAITPSGLSYGLIPEEMTERIQQLKPIDNLAPLAQAHIPLLHIHGDADTLVPLNPNSTITVERYRALGGSIELKVMTGSVHGGTEFFTDRRAIEFLLAPMDADEETAQ